MRDAKRPIRQWLRGRRGLLAASLLVAAGFAWLLHAGALPVVPPPDAFAGVRWWTAPVFALIWVLVLLVRSVRWALLLAPIQRVALRRLVIVSLVGFGALVLLPFRMGEIVRPALIRRKGELSGWAATGTVGAERIIDGLVLSLLLLATLQVARPMDPLPERIGDLPVPVAVVPGAAYSAVLVFTGAFVLMALFHWRRRWARHALEWVLGLVSKRAGRWLADVVGRFSRGFDFLPRWRYTVPFVLVTVFHWALSAAGIWLLLWGCGLESMHFTQALVILGVLALGILVPAAPGYFGSFQIATYAALALYISPTQVMGTGAVAVFLLYVLQIGVTLLAAAGALAVDRASRQPVLQIDVR